MTLIEKFHQWLKTEPFSSKERPTLREAQCEQIADDYAIEFAVWIDDFYYQHDVQKNKYARSRQDFIDGEVFRIKQLLEIFKKEKGL